MTANGTEERAKTAEKNAGKEQDTLVPPKLKIGGETFHVRDLENLTWAEQIKANKLVARLGELGELLQDYFDIDDDDDDEEVEPPEEMQEQWAKVHRRIIRFGFPDAPAGAIKELTPTETTSASSRFIDYMQKFDILHSDEEGNEGDGAENRKSRRKSQKR